MTGGPPIPGPAETGPEHLLRRLMWFERRAARAAMEPFGLSPHQARAFLTLARLSGPGADLPDGEVRPARLAEHLRITPRSVTEVVDALEGAGLVARTPSPTDRRATCLHLTPRGREVLDELAGTRARLDLFGALEADERAELVRLLGKVVDALEARDEERPGAGDGPALGQDGRP